MKTLKTKEAIIDELRGHSHYFVQILIRAFETQEREPVPNDPETYAIHGQLTMRSGYATAGALTVLEGGIIRVSQPANAPNPIAKTAPPIAILATHYIALHDIETFIVVDGLPKASAEPPKSRIIT